MALSSFPLIGLKDKVKIYEKSLTLDDAGSFVEVIPNLSDKKEIRARITLLDFEDEKMQTYFVGIDPKKSFKFLWRDRTRKTEVLTNKKDLIVYVVNSNVAPVGHYKIFYLKAQQDNKGLYHHTTAFAELL
jgi:hypothetical protein